MDRYFGRIPPLSALRGFEAAARLGSFSRAAEEQNMTQSAISHQVKALEEFFRQPLFKRIGRTVELTDAGRDFLETAGRSLQLLARGTRRLDSYLKPGSVILTTSPAFASKWLIPRFAELASEHPDLQPWLYTTDEYAELEHAELDIAVWRGDGNWPGLRVEKLFDDWVTPVCAPGLLQDRDGTGGAEDLSEQRLLHDERRPDWHEWLRHAGIERSDVSEGFNFSDSGLLLDSAAAGHGFALGSLVLSEGMVGSGTLQRPFETAIRSEESYYAVCIEMHLRRPAVRAMWNWLIEHGARFEAQLQADAAAQAGGG